MIHQRTPRPKPTPSFSPPSNLPPKAGAEQPPPLSPAYAVSSSSTFRPPSPVARSRRPLAPDDKKNQSPVSVWSKLFSSRLPLVMLFLLSWLLVAVFWMNGGSAGTMNPQQKPYPERGACPDYKDYSTRKHRPYTIGAYKLPFQRPARDCRLFKSDAVEDLVTKMTALMEDVDMARLFENCFPNTLDTTVRWHLDADKAKDKQSFIVTGDINAQWLRDSTNQLTQYQILVAKDPALKNLILGAINTQADFILQSPYCNAFQPPKASGLEPYVSSARNYLIFGGHGAPPGASVFLALSDRDDTVHPTYDNTVVFECKYEIDSLASFLALGNQYYNHTLDSSFVSTRWLAALGNVLDLIEEQRTSTFASDGTVNNHIYNFRRVTTRGTETLNLDGMGNPIGANTSLIRSAFRPSDDAVVMQFFIPGNAFMAVELQRTARVLTAASQPELAAQVTALGEEIEAGVWKHGVVQHSVFGKVFAYEVDGYGSHIIMDDANLPSLLALPLLGFVGVDNEVYRNTRKMILSRQGNPYYLTGSQFQGIGGPHIGITYAWPISLLVQAMTSDDDEEIKSLLASVLRASPLGLIHESVNVERVTDYTRSWFAWANSVYAQTILDLAHRKPHLIFKQAG